MALFSTLKKQTRFSIILDQHISYYYTSSSAAPGGETLVSEAVAVLKHHRSKSRWNRLLSLVKPTSGFTPSQVSEIILQLRNKPHLALCFFDFTVHHNLCSHNLSSYSTIIHTLARSRQKSRARTLIHSAMRRFPTGNFADPSEPHPVFESLISTYQACDSAPFVFDLLIKACLESKKIAQSIALVRTLKSKNFYLEVSTCNSLIELVSKSNGSLAAYKLYREVFGFETDDLDVCGFGIVKCLAPNSKTLNILMVSFYRDGLADKVEEIWRDFERLKCEPDSYSYSILMAMYCNDGRMNEAKRVWEQMSEKGAEHDIVAYNTLIGGFCKIGEIDRAEEMYAEMVSQGQEGTSVTFEHLVLGHCKIGDVETAIVWYRDMERRGLTPESSTVHAIIQVLCTKSRISEALEFLKASMKRHNIVPMKQSYELLINSLCGNGRMEEAVKLQAEMAGKGQKPNSEIYSAFIHGYVKQGNEEMAEKLRKEMLDRLNCL